MLNLMTPGTIAAAAGGAMKALLGNKTNGFLLYFELFIPTLDKPTFGIGRIIAALLTFFFIIYGTAPMLLCATAAVVHTDSFNFWTVTFSELPTCASKQELHRSFTQMKVFNKFTNEAFWFGMVTLLVFGVSILIACNVVMVTLVDKMSFISFIIVALVWLLFMIGAGTLMSIPGKMNKFSEEFIRRIKVDGNEEIKRLGRSMESLRFQISIFFVIKMTTYMEIMQVVFDNTINVLLALEEITNK